MKRLLLFTLAVLTTGLIYAQNLTVDEIISKTLTAMGQDKLMKVNTIKTTGKMTQAGTDIIGAGYEKKPDLDRAEMEIQGVKIIMVREGNTGWMINPMTGSSDPQDLPEEVITNMIDAGRSDPDLSWENPFYTLKESGTSAELIGKEDIGGTPVYNVKLTFKDGYVVNFYIDADKFLVLRSKSTEKQQGQTYEQEIRFSDFKTLDGIVYTGKIETFVNGQVATVSTTEKVEFDVPMDDSLFKKPVKQ